MNMKTFCEIIVAHSRKKKSPFRDTVSDRAILLIRKIHLADIVAHVEQDRFFATVIPVNKPERFLGSYEKFFLRSLPGKGSVSNDKKSYCSGNFFNRLYPSGYSLTVRCAAFLGTQGDKE